MVPGSFNLGDAGPYFNVSGDAGPIDILRAAEKFGGLFDENAAIWFQAAGIDYAANLLRDTTRKLTLELGAADDEQIGVVVTIANDYCPFV
ncbi:MAG: hypothetical protein ACI91O_000906 [Candidatus Poriferisodalaceae bacterium]|jgi:hypothetical protein